MQHQVHSCKNTNSQPLPIITFAEHTSAKSWINVAAFTATSRVLYIALTNGNTVDKTVERQNIITREIMKGRSISSSIRVSKITPLRYSTTMYCNYRPGGSCRTPWTAHCLAPGTYMSTFINSMITQTRQYLGSVFIKSGRLSWTIVHLAVRNRYHTASTVGSLLFIRTKYIWVNDKTLMLCLDLLIQG